MVLKTSISGDVSILETGSNPDVDYLKANVFLFPKNNFQQAVSEQLVTMEPEASSSVNEGNVFIQWDNVPVGKINFKIDTTVNVQNDFPKVVKTVRFPIHSLDSDFEEYTQETAHIDIDDGIRAEANELVAGETDLYVAAYKVGEWVKGNIKYDLNTLTAEADQKSSWVFVNKKGVCDEITNLFISMLRSVNVPARFVSGLVYSNLDNSFGNHGWAEVYFPGYGWLPFDVTFGQYGWIDPTHIKLDDSYDSGMPSVEYNWRSRDVEVKAGSLGFKTDVVQKGKRDFSYADISVKPLKERVSFGSYVPMEVTVKNINNYYLPLTLFVTKAPQLASKDNMMHLLLKPNDQKRVYWIIKIPSDLEEEYIYTSELEVKTGFGAVASNVVKYAEGFEQYSQSAAEEVVKQLSEREDKFFFSDLDLECAPDKESYYSIEEANIACSVVNNGNVQLNDVRVCLAEECEKLSLGIGEKMDVSFAKQLVKSEVVALSAENKDKVRYSEVKLNVVEIPDLQITSVEPKFIGYDEAGVLVVSLVTESTAYEVKAYIKGLGVAEWEKISDKSFLKIPFEGSKLYDGHVDIELSYEDALNKTYTGKSSFPITVTNIPSSVKAWMWFKNLFQ